MLNSGWFFSQGSGRCLVISMLKLEQSRLPVSNQRHLSMCFASCCTVGLGMLLRKGFLRLWNHFNRSVIGVQPTPQNIFSFYEKQIKRVSGNPCYTAPKSPLEGAWEVKTEMLTLEKLKNWIWKRIQAGGWEICKMNGYKFLTFQSTQQSPVR